MKLPVSHTIKSLVNPYSMLLNLEHRYISLVDITNNISYNGTRQLCNDTRKLVPQVHNKRAQNYFFLSLN
jgi:hypothetical protein